MSDDDSEQRARGKALMRDVYGWDIDPTKPFEVATVDHLFGEVWAEGKLSVRDRRLLLIGLAAGTGLEDVAGLQLDAAMNLGELDADDLRTIVVFLAHYAGWPRGAKLNAEVEKIIGRHAKAAAKAAAPSSAINAPVDVATATAETDPVATADDADADTSDASDARDASDASDAADAGPVS